MISISIIETTDILRLRIERTLKKYGLTTFENVPSQRLLLSHAQSIFYETDLIILDYDNVEYDVLSFIRNIRFGTQTKHIPIIVLTASREISTVKHAVEAGASDLIIKPFEDVKLIEKIYKVRPTPTYKQLESDYTGDGELLGEGIKLSWSSDFEIGIEAIDKEHREIIEKYEFLYAQMKAGSGHAFYKELITFLDEYVNVHFKHEEALQIEYGYDRLVEHKAAHADFEKQVAIIIEAHNNVVVKNSDLISINLFIKNWLVHHILIEDKRIGEFIANKLGHTLSPDASR